MSSFQDRFRLHSERVVERVLRNSCVFDFDDLLRHLPGTYPSDVLLALSGLGIEVPFAPDAMPDGPPSRLPLGHPGDCSWRFSRATAAELAERCVRATKDGDTIVMLGVPEVFLSVRDSNSHRNLVLIDKDKEVVNAVSADAKPNEEIVASDLMHSRVRNYEAACVVIDPPWYPDFFRVFTWTALQMSRQGALLLLPLPGLGTRSGMAQERRSLLRWLHLLSYEASERITGALVYETPLFEQNALRAAGLNRIGRLWRRCDLATLILGVKSTIERPVVAETEPWQEFVFNESRIRVSVVCRSTHEECNTRLVPLLPGNILPSVSSNHPLRCQVKVWTTGNRVFGCKSPGELISVIRAFISGHCAESEVSVTLGRDLELGECDSVRRTVEQLELLLRDEQSNKNANSRTASECVELEG